MGLKGRDSGSLEKKGKGGLLIGIALAVLALGSYWVISFQVYDSDENDMKEDWARKDEETIRMEIRKKTLFNEILEVSGKGVCEDDADCRAIPFGAKVCPGGKRGHLYYSIKDVLLDDFSIAVNKYNEFIDDYNERSIRVLSCVGQRPDTYCLRGACLGRYDR